MSVKHQPRRALIKTLDDHLIRLIGEPLDDAERMSAMDLDRLIRAIEKVDQKVPA